jgi:competence protein ComEA
MATTANGGGSPKGRAGTDADADAEQQRAESPRAWWQSARAAVSDSAWTALGGKAAAYVAGFFALALVGSGNALSLLPHRASGANAELALVYGGANVASAAQPEAAPAPAAADAGAGATDGADAGAAETATERDGGAGGAPAGGGVTADGKVVLNLATEEELRRLPGVGPAKAKAILALRAKLKRFRKVEDLLRVKGLGRRSIKRLRPLVLIEAP